MVQQKMYKNVALFDIHFWYESATCQNAFEPFFGILYKKKS